MPRSRGRSTREPRKCGRSATSMAGAWDESSIPSATTGKSASPCRKARNRTQGAPFHLAFFTGEPGLSRIQGGIPWQGQNLNLSALLADFLCALCGSSLLICPRTRPFNCGVRREKTAKSAEGFTLSHHRFLSRSSQLTTPRLLAGNCDLRVIVNFVRSDLPANPSALGKG